MFNRTRRRISAKMKQLFSIDCPQTYVLSDKAYLTKKFEKKLGYKPNFRNPKTFSEKVNWIKLYDRNPKYTMMVDKYAVRKYISDTIGEEYLVPLVGDWDNADEIKYDELPEQFVMKCNHDSKVIICTSKKEGKYISKKRSEHITSLEECKKHLNLNLQRDAFKANREWPYKDIRRKIICEKYMENENGEPFTEYKIWCFNGEPKLTSVFQDGINCDWEIIDFYDEEWNLLDIQKKHCRSSGKKFEKPAFHSELMKFARIFSKDIPFVRVDFNCWNNKLYFSELTFFDAGGFSSFVPDRLNKEFGDWIKLPKKKAK